jgi:hypothetical protein
MKTCQSRTSAARRPAKTPCSDLTIATACDANYFWGAFLLTASLRQNRIGAPIHVLAKGFDAERIGMLEQFRDVRVIPLTPDNPRSLITIKPYALATARTKWLAWLDADCMAIGDVGTLLPPENGSFQIRLREPAENADIYGDKYRAGDRRGGYPAWVLERWRGDVGDLQQPRQDTAAVANAFVLHEKHRDFLQLWDQQMQKVIPSCSTLMDSHLGAYHMSDESVLNSLLAFSSIAPPVGPFQLNRHPERHVAHFGGKAKPWVRWTSGSWYCYEPIQRLLAWLRAEGHKMPPLPPSLQPRRKLAMRAGVLAAAWKTGAKRAMRRVIR